MMADQHIYTVSELNRAARAHLEDAFDAVWVKGEITGMTRAPSGHLYFTLKDEVSEISAVRFRTRSFLLPSDGLDPGTTVLAFGKLTIYEPRGRYQFIASLLQPVGAGALQAAFERLKKKLLSEGLFEEAHKKALPATPDTIGVITSPTGAAIRDIVSVLSRRWPLARVVVFPSAVQGDAAPGDLTAALERAARYSEGVERLDVLILSRGGGSAEDLAAFNDERVARAVFGSPIPIVSAVGHEIDFSITDFVADLRAPTPSAAAELVVPDSAEIRKATAALAARMNSAITACLRERMAALQSTIRVSIFRNLQRRVETEDQRLDQLLGRLSRAAAWSLQARNELLARLSDVLRLSDPRLPLHRGYSLTFVEGSTEPIRNASAVVAGTTIRTRLASGQLRSKVEEVISK